MAAGPLNWITRDGVMGDPMRKGEGFGAWSQILFAAGRLQIASHGSELAVEPGAVLRGEWTEAGWGRGFCVLSPRPFRSSHSPALPQ